LIESGSNQARNDKCRENLGELGRRKRNDFQCLFLSSRLLL